MTHIPESIKKLVDVTDYQMDNIGMSGSSILIFDDKVLKIERVCEESNHEFEIMKQMYGKLPVPKVLCHERCQGMNYLLMSKVSGSMACDEFYMQNAEELSGILAEGLKMLWRFDVSDCTYICGLDRKLKMAEYNVEHGLVDMDNVEDDTFGENGFKSPEDLLNWLKNNRPKEEYALSHGDYCLPNVFVKDGKISGYVDLGKMGLADKYQDIALCYRSLRHNYEGKYSGEEKHKDFSPKMLFEKLGIEPNWDKIKYYLLLDELF